MVWKNNHLRTARLQYFVYERPGSGKAKPPVGGYQPSLPPPG